MAVTVKYFALLREQAGLSEQRLTFVPGMTATDAWGMTMDGKVMPDNVKVAVNMEYSRAATILQDGDEVAFFPTVTGG